MSVIVRLQNLPWAANAVDIRQYFHGLSIPEGGVHIVGGELGDAFIAFSTDEDARQAMLRDGGKVKDISIKLYLSSRTEMQKIIEQARQQSLGMQQFMNMPTIAPMPVPVPNMAVPTVQNVPALQVPLQNVAAMVTNMAKPDNSVMARSVTAAGGVHEMADNKVFSSNQSVKSDIEKDKKDKRHRRTRSHSRESSNSRTDSRSRSRSRSSSRSRDRKGRDRHHDRRRKRSRSRDRRRRRERSRSRERTDEMRDRRVYNKDRRKDYNRHGSREEFDDNSQSRWNNSAQRNRPNKQKPDPYNRNIQNQNQNRGHYQQKLNSSKGDSNSDIAGSFPDDSTSQTSISNDPKTTSLPSTQTKDNNSILHPSGPNISSTGPSATPAPNTQNMPSNQNFFGNLPPPPMFSPQNMVSYPNYTPTGISGFNNFPQIPNHGKNTSRKPEIGGKSDFTGSESRNSPGADQILKGQNKVKTDLPQERGASKFGDKPPTIDAALPSNDKVHPSRGGSTDWGYNENNYRYNKDAKTGSNTTESFNSGWSNNNSNVNNKMTGKKLTNSCVQIRNAPDHTKHEDIRGFFRNSRISEGCLKIARDEKGRVTGVYVKFDNVGDKKKAICRSGCLLNNSIVTIFHVDDDEFNNAIDIMDDQPPYWNSGNEHMNKDDMTQKSGLMNLENEHEYDCIKFQGSIRFHPFFNPKSEVHPHIRSLCEKFGVIDVFVIQSRVLNTVDAFIKLENSSVAAAAVDFLRSVKVDGKPVVVSTCSTNEYVQSKVKSIPMDVQDFLRTALSRPQPLFGKPNVKPEDRIDPRLQSTTYNDRRSKADDHGQDDDQFTNDMEMKNNDDGPDFEFKKNNKVLLPTPSPMQFQTQMQFQKDNFGMNTNCVLIQNLPLQANDHDILEFFSDIGVVPTQIHIMLDPNGKQYGDAFCEFEKNEEAMNASNKNNFVMNKNNIYVRLVSRQEMSNALGLSVPTAGPNVMGGPPGGPFFNGPPGMFGGNPRMDFPMGGGNNNWMPPFNPNAGPMGQNPPNFGAQSDRGFRGGRGGQRGRDGDYGVRGGRGRGDSDFGGRGGRGRGGDRGSRGRGDMGGRGGRGREDGGSRGMSGNRGSMRGSHDSRGARGSGDMGRGRSSRGMRGGMSRGRRDMNEFPRNQPPDLMSLQSPPMMDQLEGPPPLIQSSKAMSRPIQLEEDSVRKFGQPGCVVSAENVPYRAELNDILDFFSDYDVTAESIIRRYNDLGQVTGDARIAFRTPEEAKKAIRYLNNKQIGNRNVSLSLFK